MNDLILTPKIKKLVVKLTNICNLECKHCYVSSHPNGEYGLQKSDVFKIIEESHEMFGSILFTLSGGEALVRRKDALDIIAHAQKFHNTAIYSNGTLFTPLLSKEIAKLAPLVQVSIDGSSEKSHDKMRGKGNYQKTIKGLTNLIEAGLDPAKIQIFCSVTEATVAEMEKVLELVGSIGITRVRFEPIAKTGRAVVSWGAIENDGADPDTKKYLTRIEELPKWINDWELEDRQDLNFNLIKIYSDGAVLPYAFYNIEDKKSGTMGNIKEQSLSDILRPENFTKTILDKYIQIASGPPRSLKAIQFTKKNSKIKWDRI